MTRSIFIRSRKNAFTIAAAGVLVAAAGAVALAAPAQADAAVTESVYVSAQKDNSFLVVPQKVTVSSDEAENYGYTDQVSEDEGVSQLDVLVKAHEVKYGSAFTEATAKNHLDLAANIYGSYGITRAFDTDTEAWGIVADNASAVNPDDGDSDGYYKTQYAVTQAKVKSGQAINFFKYQDAYYGDLFTYFAPDSKNNTSYINSVSTYTGKALSLNIEGLKIGGYGGAIDSVRAANTSGFAGATLATVDSSGALTPLKSGDAAIVTDSNGNASVTFGKAGTYVVSATPASGTYATSPWIIVNVTAAASNTGTSSSGTSSSSKTPSAKTKIKKGYTTTVSGAKYQVTNASKKYVTYVKAPSKKATVTVPATVKIGSTSYKVTKVAAKAFKSNKKVKTVKIGKNVTKIAKSAFYKTPNLKKLVVSSKHLKAKSAVKGSFKGSKLKKKLTVNANKIAAKYIKKSFTKKNLATPTKVKQTVTKKSA